jgi:purine-binding chemotaxis protein CheW
MMTERSAFPAPIGTKGDTLIRLVVFRLDRQLYALPLKNVERALHMVAIAPVPEAPPWVPGVISLHGQVVPVVDLRQRFGRPGREPDLNDRLLVVQALGQTAVLWVDEVTEVLEVPSAQVEPPPQPLSRSRPLAGIVRRDEELILVLDASRLLPPEEAVGAASQDVEAGEREGTHHANADSDP